MVGASALRIRQQVLEDVIEHLHAYAEKLDDAGDVESEDNAVYVRASIQQLKDAFSSDHEFYEDGDEDDD